MDFAPLSQILLQTFDSLSDNIPEALGLPPRAVSRAICGTFLLGSHYFIPRAAFKIRAMERSQGLSPHPCLSPRPPGERGERQDVYGRREKPKKV
jgi:hypothetical protein